MKLAEQKTALHRFGGVRWFWHAEVKKRVPCLPLLRSENKKIKKFKITLDISVWFIYNSPR